MNVNFSLLSVFIPTFIVVSATPGMCMTLAMTLGMTIGVRRTLWMMVGELVGVGLVAIAGAVGVASVMLSYPTLFVVLKSVGGLYLCWLGIQLWRSRGKMAVLQEGVSEGRTASRYGLIVQGFVTAVANPKGWAFIISLLPPFIDSTLPLLPQLTMLVLVILIIEFCFLLFYAQGGKSLRKLLQRKGNVQKLNRVAGTMMFGVGLWLGLG